MLSPSNTISEMTRKFQFYHRHGVEEYYLCDPDEGTLDGFVRQGTALAGIERMEDWVSPRLGTRFGITPQGDLQLWRPDGTPFESYVEMAARAEQESLRAQMAEQRAERLAERLRQLGIDPDNGELSS